MAIDAVLIVDDSLTVRMDLVEAFAAAGFRPLPCATLAEARETLARETVTLIVLDVLLPDGDGIDFLVELRAGISTARTVVLLLSTETEVKNRLRGLRTGADEYVGKPYDVKYLIAKARELATPTNVGEGAPTVLVIDDSPTMQRELSGVLEAAGYVVLTASNGEDGLQLAAIRRPSAIIVDGVLPGMDGASVIRHVRLDAALRGVPCLLLTGSENERAELDALDAGADAFLRKDGDLTVVLAKLRAILRRDTALASPDETASLLGPKKILAVDDSATFLQVVAEALRGEGYDVILARSGEEALELLAVQSVDCILLDLLMPGLNGHEVCRRIKAAPGVRHIPIIMLTAMEDRGAVIEGLGSGADDYIAKSSEFEVLKARVRAQIRRKQFEDENRSIRQALLRKEFEAAHAQSARRLAETRAALVDELERKNRELEAFSYSVSHDLRAPLRAITSFSQILRDEHASALDAIGTGYLQRVCDGARRMGELIEDILELSRLGRADLHRAPTNLSDLARLVISELKTADPDRVVDIEIQPDVVADVDRGLARVLLDNLLGNAWKFTGHVENATIQFRTERTENGVVYCIRDNGAGFDMAYAGKLFNPFQRLHRETEFPGTGIGLATVQRIVDRHGGRIWAEAAVGAGASISFTLPPAKPVCEAAQLAS